MSASGSPCIAQTYWYENGEQRARFCDKPATMTVRSVGIRNRVCDEHGAMMIEAGATRVASEVTP